MFWEKVRKSDYAGVKVGAQAIYLAESRAQAEAAFRRFRTRWRREYGAMVRRLERDLPELLSFYAFPRHRWRKLRTTNGSADRARRAGRAAGPGMGSRPPMWWRHASKPFSTAVHPCARVSGKWLDPGGSQAE
jgi:hypothetical protein